LLVFIIKQNLVEIDAVVQAVMLFPLVHNRQTARWTHKQTYSSQYVARLAEQSVASLLIVSFDTQTHHFKACGIKLLKLTLQSDYHFYFNSCFADALRLVGFPSVFFLYLL